MVEVEVEVVVVVELEPFGPEQAPTKRRTAMLVRLMLFVLGGSLVGFLYYRFVGCRTGTCPITSNPYISTVYGAVMGYLMSGVAR